MPNTLNFKNYQVFFSVKKLIFFNHGFFKLMRRQSEATKLKEENTSEIKTQGYLPHQCSGKNVKGTVVNRSSLIVEYDELNVFFTW